MNEFGNLLGTPYAPVSKIEPVKGEARLVLKIIHLLIVWFIFYFWASFLKFLIVAQMMA